MEGKRYFKGEYFFLSNFYEAPILYDGRTYNNNEAAFQSMKSLDPIVRDSFKDLPPKEAKSKGRKIKLRPDWEEVKDKIMYDICLAKVVQYRDLAYKLFLTGDEYLEEGNTWGDKYWGTVDGEGKNMLGKILMSIRSNARIDIVE